MHFIVPDSICPHRLLRKIKALFFVGISRLHNTIYRLHRFLECTDITHNNIMHTFIRYFVPLKWRDLMLPSMRLTRSSIPAKTEPRYPCSSYTRRYRAQGRELPQVGFEPTSETVQLAGPNLVKWMRTRERLVIEQETWQNVVEYILFSTHLRTQAASSVCVCMHVSDYSGASK